MLDAFCSTRMSFHARKLSLYLYFIWEEVSADSTTNYAISGIKLPI